MNKKIEKRQVIVGLHNAGKTSDEIQTCLIMLFQDDSICSTQVKTRILLMFL